MGNASAIFVGDTSGANSATLATDFNGLAFTQNITVRSGSSGTASLGGNNTPNPTFSGNITLNKDVTLTGLQEGAGATFSGIISSNGAANNQGGQGGGGQGGPVAGFRSEGIISTNGPPINPDPRPIGGGGLGGGGGNAVTNVTVSAGYGGGTITLTGANTYTGNTSILAGTLSISSDANLGSNATASTLQIDEDTLLDTANVTLSANRTIALAYGPCFIDVTSGHTLNYGGIIDDYLPASDQALETTDAGTLVLSGNSRYTGGTLVYGGGTLQIGVDNALPTTTTLYLGDGNFGSGTFDLNGFNQTVSGLGTASTDTTDAVNGTVTDSAGPATFTVDTDNGNSTYGGLLTGSLALTEKDIFSANTLTLSGNNSYTGNTSVVGGMLSISADDNLGAVPANATPGALQLNGGTLQATANFTLNSNRGIALGPNAGGGYIDVTGGNTLSYGGIIDDDNHGDGQSLMKTDNGTLFLSGNSLYTGSTFVEGGTLQIAVDNALPTTTSLYLGDGNFGSGAFDLNGFNQTVGGLNSYGAGVNNTVTNSNSGLASTFTVNGGGTYGGVLSGNLALVMDGVGNTLNLTGASTYTGSTLVASGTLAVNNTSGSATGSGNVTVNGDGTLDGSAELAGNGTISGAVTVNGIIAPISLCSPSAP